MSARGEASKQHGPSSLLRQYSLDLMDSFFRQARVRIDSSGFVVIANLFKSLQDNHEAPTPTNSGGNFLHYSAFTFFDHWLKQAPTEDEIVRGKCSPSHYRLWSGIRNTEKEEEYQIQETSRLMHMKYTTTGYYEDGLDNGEKRSVLDSKCAIEVCIIQIAAWMRLQEMSYDETKGNQSSLFSIYKNRTLTASDTGGRMIINGTPSTANQVAHLDPMFAEGIPLAPDGYAESPPYFAIVSFDEPVPLWVLEGSHPQLSRPESHFGEVGTSSPTSVDLHTTLASYRGSWGHYSCWRKWISSARKTSTSISYVLVEERHPTWGYYQ